MHNLQNSALVVLTRVLKFVMMHEINNLKVLPSFNYMLRPSLVTVFLNTIAYCIRSKSQNSAQMFSVYLLLFFKRFFPLLL
jgi:hypothetical protein